MNCYRPALYDIILELIFSRWSKAKDNQSEYLLLSSHLVEKVGQLCTKQEVSTFSKVLNDSFVIQSTFSTDSLELQHIVADF
eukprot:Awhi_evm1s5255